MIGLWFIMFLMAGWQIPRLIQKNQLKELTVFLLLWLIAGIYGSLVLLDVALISPFEIIKILVEKII